MTAGLEEVLVEGRTSNARLEDVTFNHRGSQPWSRVADATPHPILATL
jgi:hypothetical protein